LEKGIFIFLAAQSPRLNVISSRRIEGLAHYISEYFETYVIAGIPKSLESSKIYPNYNIGSAKLIEVPSIFNKKKFTAKESTTKSSNHTSWSFEKIRKRAKSEAFPFLEMFLPVSPGGMVYHDQKKFFDELEKIIVGNYQKRKIYIFASYGPSFILKIAKRIKKKYPCIEFVADFRDWAYKNCESSFYHSHIYKMYTKSLLKKADKVTFVSKTMLEYYKEKINLSQPVLYLSNGFDPSKIQAVGNEAKPDTEIGDKINIAYTGSTYYKTRNPENFIECLSGYIKSSNVRVTFTYAGKDGKIIQEIVGRHNLGTSFDFRGMLSHKDSLRLQQEADILLLLVYTGEDQFIGSSMITGKFFEYLASGRPILVIGPKTWEMKEIVESDKVSKVIQDGDCESIKQFLEDFSSNMRKFDLTKRSELLEMFSYKRLAETLAEFVLGRY